MDGELDGLDDLLVTSAAAQVAGQGFADFGARGLRVVVEQGARAEHHAGLAKAALQGARAVKGVLDRVGAAAAGGAVGGHQAFDRCNTTSFAGAGQLEAGQLRLASY